jgi:hypothetical protein
MRLNLGKIKKRVPGCHHPRWYTLKKTSILLLIIVLLLALIKYVVVFGDRTLSQWFG